MKKLVIIPAFNESGSILRAVQDIKEHAPGFDYVVINDCSTDDTLQVCQKNGLNHVNLSVNLGIGGAVQTGYLYGCQNHYDVAVQFDGDGQHDAAYLEQMAEELVRTGSDMVIGSRFIEKEGFQSSGLRRVGIRYFSTLIRLVTGARVTDPTSGMRMVNRDVMKIYAENYPKDYPEPEECGGDSSEKEESNGASGDYEGERRGNFLYCRTEIRLLYDKSNPCNFYGNLKTLERRVGL